jgi:hypothetical protein
MTGGPPVQMVKPVTCSIFDTVKSVSGSGSGSGSGSNGFDEQTVRNHCRPTLITKHLEQIRFLNTFEYR